jgi:hypothetical protein
LPTLRLRVFAFQSADEIQDSSAMDRLRQTKQGLQERFQELLLSHSRTPSFTSPLAIVLQPVLLFIQFAFLNQLRKPLSAGLQTMLASWRYRAL